jgi:hypothetical protein
MPLLDCCLFLLSLAVHTGLHWWANKHATPLLGSSYSALRSFVPKPCFIFWWRTDFHLIKWNYLFVDTLSVVLCTEVWLVNKQVTVHFLLTMFFLVVLSLSGRRRSRPQFLVRVERLSCELWLFWLLRWLGYGGYLQILVSPLWHLLLSIGIARNPGEAWAHQTYRCWCFVCPC